MKKTRKPFIINLLSLWILFFVCAGSFRMTVNAAYEFMPEITAQPKDVVIAEGKTAVFSVSAEGGNLRYQWKYYSDGVWKNSTGEGARTSKLRVPAETIRDGNWYYCWVENNVGWVNSDPASLTIISKPKLQTNPKSVTAAEGSMVYFSVAAKGKDLRYQWQYCGSDQVWRNSGGDGAGTPTLQIPATTGRSGNKYRCIVKNQAGSVTSKAASLTVLVKPSITVQPKNVTSVPGKTVTFSVKAAGSKLNYQWQYYHDSQWKNSSGEGNNTAVLKVEATSARNGNWYRCVVKNSIGTVISSSALLTVAGQPLIAEQPKNAEAAEDAAVTFSVKASGTGLVYQWQVWPVGSSSWVNFSGSGAAEDTISFTVHAADDRSLYRCIVKNAVGSVTSESAILTVRDLLPVNEKTFPDAAFRKLVSEMDKDKSGTLSASEISACTQIRCAGKGIESLAGIGYFRSLTSLDCSSNRLTDLDLSANTALEHLYCSQNQLTVLDLSANTRLVTLICSENSLYSLPLKELGSLQILLCDHNRLTRLNLGNKSRLRTLDCSGNKLVRLTLNNCTQLKEMDCSDNLLKELTVDDCRNLSVLNCEANSRLKELDVSALPVLCDCIRFGEYTLIAGTVQYENADASLSIDQNLLLEY